MAVVIELTVEEESRLKALIEASGEEVTSLLRKEGTNPSLHETLEEIGRLTSLEEDWNDEGAPVIDHTSILRAQKFVQWLACVAAEQGLTGDCAPTVFPTIDGGVKLFWKANGHQVALTFHPDQNTIAVREKAVGAVASHQVVSEKEAGKIALKAMREAI